MTRPNNPLYLAREAQNMAKNAGSHGQFFQKMAAVGMCMVTVMTGMHLLNELYKELYARDRQQGRGR